MWAFYTPIFHNSPFWDLFSFQLGIHREGIGLIITKYIASLTGWNSRADAFAIGVSLVLAMIGAYILKIRLFGKISFSDIVIPILFLSPMQYDLFTGTPQLTSQGIPLLLSIIYCLCWLIPKRPARMVCVILVNFICIYTGYTVFLGLVTILIFAFDVVFNYKKGAKYISGDLLALIISILSLASFFIGYQKNTGGPCFVISPNYIIRWPAYMAIMFSEVIGIDYNQAKIAAFSAGIIIVLVISILFITKIIKYKDHPENKGSDFILLVLLSFSLAFALSTAIGRICLGFAFAASSRYVTLLIPAFLGVYFSILTMKKFFLQRVVLSILLIILLIPYYAFPKYDQSSMLNFYNAKTAWKQCYLKYENIEKCNNQTNFAIAGWLNDDLVHKFEYLKENHLNLYLDQ